MGHGIETIRDFVKGIGTDTDWHKLTQLFPKLEREMFPDMIKADTSWGVPNWGIDNRPLVTDSEPWRMLVCDDDRLPVGVPFQDSFQPFVPRRAWDYVQSVLQGTGFEVERIGLLKNRTFWFISVKLSELQGIAPAGEKFQLNFSGDLTGKLAPQAEVSHIRAVCWNTISASRVSGQVLFRLKQTKNFDIRLEKTKTEVEKAVGMARIFNEQLRKVETKPCTTDRARDIYAGFIADEKAEKLSTTARNTIDGLVNLFERGDGNQGQTMADCLHGFTQYGTRGLEGTKRDALSRVESSEMGTFAQRKADFAQLLFGPSITLNNVAKRGHDILMAN
jgi:hypothetical protein